MKALPLSLAICALSLMTGARADDSPAMTTPAANANASASAGNHLADAVSTPRADIRSDRPRSAAINGGLLVLPLPADQSSHLYYHGHRVWTGQVPGMAGPVAVIGLGLDDAGEQSLSLDAAGQQPLLHFTVSQDSYPEQRLVLKETKYVSPDPAQLARFAREAAEQKAAYQVFTPAPAAATGEYKAADWPTFRWPLAGRLSSPFGLKRFFNDEPRAPHLGLDIAGRTGMIAQAPADGRIAITGDYFFNGRTVIIDHGQGLYSMLCHFSEILVKPGDVVHAGDPVGKVGATGRATGPHLHWTVSLNDARIDPRWLMPGDAAR